MNRQKRKNRQLRERIYARLDKLAKKSEAAAEKARSVVETVNDLKALLVSISLEKPGNPHHLSIMPLDGIIFCDDRMEVCMEAIHHARVDLGRELQDLEDECLVETAACYSAVQDYPKCRKKGELLV